MKKKGDSGCSSVENRVGKVLSGDITRKNEVDSVCTVNNSNIARKNGDYTSMKKRVIVDVALWRIEWERC